MKNYNIIDAQLDYMNNNLFFKREVSCFYTVEHGILSLTSNNSSGMVRFNFDEIWKVLKDQKGKYNFVCMIHTHPDNLNIMSSIDENMVRGWVMMLGCPIIFIIVTNDTVTAYKCYIDRNEVIMEDYYRFNHNSLDDDMNLLISIIYGLSVSEIMSEESIGNVANTLKQSCIAPDPT